MEQQATATEQARGSSGTCPQAPGSLLVLLLLALLSLVLAHVWVVWVLPPFNSDHLGCDACHHAVLIHCQSLSEKAQRAFLADVMVDYPQTAHRLAACWMPLLGGDAYKAMRAVSAASVLLLLLCQFALLRQVLSPGLALLSLLSWQMLCYLTNLANVQYYCVAYFFSQAVGMVFVWAAVLLVSWPASHPWQRGLLTTLGALFAGLAYLCHIVPGVAILGGLGLFFLVCWWRSRRFDDLARVVLIGTVGLAVVLGTADQLLHLGKSRTDPGPVPLKNWGLLLAWIPTLLVVLWLAGRSWSTTGSGKLLGVLTSVLAVAGLLQGYCALEYLLGKSALYSVNKFFYVLFPISTLMWLLAGVSWLTRLLGQEQNVLTRIRGGWPDWVLGTVLVGLLLYLNARVWVKNELLDEQAGPDRHPVRVAERLLRETRADGGTTAPLWRGDRIYFDPALAQSSVFVNVVGLHRTWKDAYQVKESLAGWSPPQPPPGQLQQVRFRQLVLPPLLELESQKSEVRKSEVKTQPSDL